MKSRYVPNRKRPPLSEQEIAEAKAMQAEGVSWRAIARHFGYGHFNTARRQVDVVYQEVMRAHERRQELKRQEARARREADHARVLAIHRANEEELARRQFANRFSSIAEARRLHARGVGETRIAGLLKMPYREVRAAVEGRL